jgi:uncharacterized protein involved in type VI secretion and phage assembly
MSSGPFLGKYRGTVRDNIDPDGLGRIRAIVPSVTGNDEPSTWALPCLPAAGPGMGLFTVPQVGSAVWIEYEGGDPGYPIWAGGYWRRGEVPNLVPVESLLAPTITLQTPKGNGIVICDATGKGVVVQSASGAKISVTDKGVITIANGQNAVIELTGISVNVNGDALTIK